MIQSLLAATTGFPSCAHCTGDSGEFAMIDRSEFSGISKIDFWTKLCRPYIFGRMIAAACVQEAESSIGHGRGSETVSVSTQGCLLLFWCRSAEMKSHLNVKRFSKLNLLFFCVTTFAITKLTEMVKWVLGRELRGAAQVEMQQYGTGSCVSCILGKCFTLFVILLLSRRIFSHSIHLVHHWHVYFLLLAIQSFCNSFTVPKTKYNWHFTIFCEGSVFNLQTTPSHTFNHHWGL